MAFRELKIEEINLNPFTLIGKEWMLITAGNLVHHNTMTASFGGLGYLWSKNVATVYIRDQRYTKQFIDKEEYFTLSFFDKSYRRALGILGSRSGKNIDKESLAGVQACRLDNTVAFEEANMVLVCRKLYCQGLTGDHFHDQSLGETEYPQKDYHTMYIGEIVKIYEQDI